MQHRAFRRTERHFAQTVNVLQEFILDLVGKRRSANPLGIVFLVRLLGFSAQFLADDLHLLFEKILALVILQTLAHLGVQFVFEFQNAALVLKKLYERFQAPKRIGFFQNTLLIPIIEQNIGGYKIGKHTGIGDCLHRNDDFRRHFGQQLDMALKGADCLAAQRFALDAAVIRDDDVFHQHPRAQEVVILDNLRIFRAVLAVNKNAVVAVGQFEGLLYLGSDAGGAQANLVGSLDLLHGGKENGVVIRGGGVQGTHGFFIVDFKAGGNARKNDQSS